MNVLRANVRLHLREGVILSFETITLYCLLLNFYTEITFAPRSNLLDSITLNFIITRNIILCLINKHFYGITATFQLEMVNEWRTL